MQQPQSAKWLAQETAMKEMRMAVPFVDVNLSRYVPVCSSDSHVAQQESVTQVLGNRCLHDEEYLENAD